MITQILALIEPWKRAQAVVSVPAAETTVALPAAHGPRRQRLNDRRAAARPGPVGILARWWARRRQHDELVALTDRLREDIGLPARPPVEYDNLRFIAMPDRAGVPGQVKRG